MMQPEAVEGSGVSVAEVQPGALARQRCPPMWLFFMVTLPYGVLGGGITGALLSYLLRREGVAVNSIANELALLGVPATLYFLWSPLADFWMRRRTWLVVSSATSAVGVSAAFQLHSFASPAAVALLFAATCAMMLNGASCGGMMAALVPEEMKTKVSSVHQVANLGGGALGGGALLLLSQHVGRTVMGLVAATVVFVPSLAALMIDEPPLLPVAEEGLRRRLGEIWTEFKGTFLRWSSLPALLLLMSPLGSGGAIGLLSGIATDYGLSGNQIAWLNGMAGSLLTAAGAMLVVLVPGRVDTRLTYTVVGIANALSIGVMCIGPMRPLTYLVGTVLYLLTVGGCWAVFTALVLQVVGGAGKSGCSRYAIAVSLGNFPVAYMAAVDGLGAKWWGTRGLPGMDMGVSLATSVGFLVWLGVTRGSRRGVAVGETPEGAV
jgi:PAT family beta-lactamase induction signal transducer AmpG